MSCFHPRWLFRLISRRKRNINKTTRSIVWVVSTPAVTLSNKGLLYNDFPTKKKHATSSLVTIASWVGCEPKVWNLESRYLHFHLGVAPESPGYPPASTTPRSWSCKFSPFSKVTQGPSGTQVRRLPEKLRPSSPIITWVGPHQSLPPTGWLSWRGSPLPRVSGPVCLESNSSQKYMSWDWYSAGFVSKKWWMAIAWRIIPFSKWLITMDSKSPNWGYSPSKWAKWLINGAY